MDTKRVGSAKRAAGTDVALKPKPSSSVKPRYLSSLRGKGDTGNNNLKLSNSKNDSGLKASTPTRNISSTSSLGCDVSVVQFPIAAVTSSSKKMFGSNKEICGEPVDEEGKRDLLDEVYNLYLVSSGTKLLLDKTKERKKTEIDKQLAALQKRVGENIEILEETKQRIDSVCLLKEQSDLLTFQAGACQNLKDEPTFTQGKSFSDLMIEIDRIKNQLPCKDVLIPETKPDIAEFQCATTRLLNSLDRISAVYGAEETTTSHVVSGLRDVLKVHVGLESAKQTLDMMVPKTSLVVMDEAAKKTV